MAVNKENVGMVEKTASRIPVLITSRPVIKDETPQNVLQSRDPLKTLTNQNLDNCLPGPSQKVTKRLDTRFVTQRGNNEEDLDWDFEVFRDNLNQTLRKYGTRDARLSSVDLENIPGPSSDGASKITPAVPSKLSAGGGDSLKKVKKTLKRPHSKGLQDTVSPISSKAYHCTICSNSNIQGPVVCKGSTIGDLGADYILDNLNYLLEIERKIPGPPKIKKAARSCVINWIMNVNGSSGIPAVVQLATWYMDCYLSSTWVTVNRLQVIAAACFWIASKMHGRYIPGRRLVKYSGQAFIEKELVTAERSVLRKLNFQTLPVVPCDFVPYLASYCDQTNQGVVEAAAEFLCQCGILVDKLLCEEHPSVVASAAVLNALMLLRHNSWISTLKKCIIYKAAEEKADNINDTCARLREAVRVVSSVGFEYKAPLFKFSCPPYYISSKIIKAVSYKDVLHMDKMKRDVRKN